MRGDLLSVMFLGELYAKGLLDFVDGVDVHHSKYVIDYSLWTFLSKPAADRSTDLPAVALCKAFT